MSLELNIYHASDLEFGDATALRGGTMTVSRDELRDAVLTDPVFLGVEIEIVKATESARITHVSDILQPDDTADRWLDDPEVFGQGPRRVRRISGVSVVVAGQVPYLGGTGLLVPRDAILDTFGPGDDLSPFAGEHHLVLTLEYAPDLSYEEYEAATTRAGLKVAAALARGVHGAPDEVEVIESGAMAGDLPVVLYACQIHSQSALLRTRFRGRPTDELMPVLISAEELVGGGVVNGALGSQASKILTWAHQTNPIVRRLSAGHGREWIFGGVILHRGHYYLFEDKQRVADSIVETAGDAGASGVLFTLGGVGNNQIEVMLAIRGCEEAGISTVLLTWEQGGPLGDQYPLSFALEEARAVVSTGSLDEPLDLPAPDRVVGRDRIRLRVEDPEGDVSVAGPLSLERRGILVGAINPVGHLSIGCVDF